MAGTLEGAMRQSASTVRAGAGGLCIDLSRLGGNTDAQALTVAGAGSKTQLSWQWGLCRPQAAEVGQRATTAS